MIDLVPQVVLAGAAMAAGLRMAGSNEAGAHLLSHMGSAGLGAAGLAGLLSAALQFAPVVVDMRGEVARPSKPGEVVMSFYADKQRPCKFLGKEVYVNGDRGREKAYVSVLNDPTPGASRPGGDQWLGDWLITFPADAKARSVSVVVDHDCGRLFGLTRTETGPFPIPGAL